MKTQHTPGPWKWIGDTDSDYSYSLKSLQNENHVVIRLEDVYPGYPECGQDLRMDIEAANAKLIASAPSLLEALQAVNQLHDAFMADDHISVQQFAEQVDKLMPTIRAAIKAATEGN